MDTEAATALVNDMLLTGLSVAFPILGVALLVGLLVSLLQVVTQIQEMTLTFVPKILGVGATVLLLGHWMLTTLKNYGAVVIGSIPNLF